MRTAGRTTLSAMSEPLNAVAEKINLLHARTIKFVTPREMQIIYLLVLGRSTKEIATQLRLSPHTVNHYKASVYGKMHVKGATHLIRHAVLDGWLGNMV